MRKFRKGLQEYIQPKIYAAGIMVSAAFTQNKEFMEEIKEVYKCNEHIARYAFGDNHYKRYRRGKNRCHRCGVKLNA